MRQIVISTHAGEHVVDISVCTRCYSMQHLAQKSSYLAVSVNVRPTNVGDSAAVYISMPHPQRYKLSQSGVAGDCKRVHCLMILRYDVRRIPITSRHTCTKMNGGLLGTLRIRHS